MSRSFSQLTYKQRLQIESNLEAGMPVKEICQLLCVSNSTIYREIRRGAYNGKYSASIAQKKYDANLSKKGPAAQLSVDKKLAQTISDYVLQEHLSPEEIKNKLRAQGIDCPSRNTIYAAIDKGWIPNVTRKDLCNTTRMFSDGLIHVPSWIRNELDWCDGDVFTMKLDGKSFTIEKLDDLQH